MIHFAQDDDRKHKKNRNGAEDHAEHSGSQLFTVDLMPCINEHINGGSDHAEKAGEDRIKNAECDRGDAQYCGKGSKADAYITEDLKFLFQFNFYFYKIINFFVDRVVPFTRRSQK
jgi:hypothetical protein